MYVTLPQHVEKLLHVSNQWSNLTVAHESKKRLDNVGSFSNVFCSFYFLQLGLVDMKSQWMTSYLFKYEGQKIILAPGTFDEDDT